MGLKFKLSLSLGNDAMSTTPDVADALREIAGKLSLGDIPLTPISRGFVFDRNGNRVGGWRIAEEAN